MKRSNIVLIKKSVGFLMLSLAAGLGYSSVVFEAGFCGTRAGTGGPNDIARFGGSGSIINDTLGRTLPRVINDDPMAGGGSYLSCIITNPLHSSSVRMIKFKPGSVASSLDAMTDVVNDDRVINGGFDFFFRSDTTLLGGEMRPLDVDNRGNGGLRFVLGSEILSGVRGLRLEMLSNTDGLLAGGEGGSSNALCDAFGEFVIESNTVYHIGLSFATDTEGSVTAKIWGREGTGAIDLSTSTWLIGSVTFGINESVVTKGFASSDYEFGGLRFDKISFDSMIQEYDQFRLYDATPTTFGALETPMFRDYPGAEIILQADFKGSGSGTGGKDDIVTLGGTATLYDGPDSDASIFNTAPFVTSGMSSSGGYLSVLTTNSTIGGRVNITPSSSASSLAAMTVVTNGHIVLRGGLDFFFRNLRDISKIAEFRPIDTNNLLANGLRLVLYNLDGNKFRLKTISNNASGLYTGGEGGPPVKSFVYDFPAHISSNTLYHLGISFDGTDSGNVTAEVWLKEGTGAIDFSQDIPVGSLTFGINESVVATGFATGNFAFGKLDIRGDLPSTQEFDCLRIYKETPGAFSALPVPVVGTVILIN